MNITYHKATQTDIQTLVDNRILFALELSGPQNEEDIQSLRNQMTNYFSKATTDNSCISVVAKCDGIVAGIGSVHLREMPGNLKNPSGKWGYIMNMYTVPQYRRKGVCKGILNLLVEEGKKVGITAFELHATHEGEKVYVQEGFVHHNEPTLRKICKMKNWINHPLKLDGNKIVLVPLEETHFEELINASQEEIIWTYMPVKGTDKQALGDALELAIKERENNQQYPFVVLEKETQKIIGCTRFLKLSEEHRNLEIGWTWYLPDYWGKGYNEECKLLLLTYCFEVLKTIRVQIIASDKNLRSRKAIENIGGKFEGILRNVVLRHDGPRTTAYYSIINDEWEDVKDRLTQRLENKTKNKRNQNGQSND